MIEPHVQQMLDLFPALSFVVDERQCLVQVSKGAGNLLGYDPQAVAGKHLQHFLAAEDLPRTTQALAQLRDTPACSGVILRLRHNNGTLVPFTFYATVNPETKWVYGMAQKVPFAASTHAPSGNSLIQVSEEAAYGVLVLDAQLAILSIDETAVHILGQQRGEMKGTSIFQYLGDLRNSVFETQLQSVLQNQVPVRFECFTPALQYQWLELAAFPNVGNLGLFIRNIDRQKKAEQNLWKLSLIARETTNLVVLTDAWGNINWVNKAYTRITGFSMEEAVGANLATFLSGLETDNATILQLQESIEKGEAFVAEILLYDRWGNKIWFEMQCQPVKDASGRTDQFFSIHTDITKRKEFEEQLQQEQQQRQRTITRATIEAQERERSLVSQELHDNVNQVLTTVKLYTELCLTGINQQEELLRKSVALLQQSINEIRSLSKRLSAPTLGKVQLRDSVKELTDSIAATNRLEIDTDLKLLNTLEIPQELHLAIYRILQEHFTNILKHSSARKVLVLFEAVNDELVLKVRDDGKGFNTKELSGGIGIANMLTRAESMKGTLTLNSAPGLGCVLLVRFPLAA